MCSSPANDFCLPHAVAGLVARLRFRLTGRIALSMLFGMHVDTLRTVRVACE